MRLTIELSSCELLVTTLMLVLASNQLVAKILDVLAVFRLQKANFVSYSTKCDSLGFHLKP